MAVLTGPLMSLSASGTIAKTLTYGNWKGIQYARTRVIPANPQSTSQTQTRDVFRFLQDYYKFAPTIAREPWIAAVTGIPMTAQNLLLSKNTGVLRTLTDLDSMVLSPGAKGGTPPSAIVSTPGSGTLTVAVTAPTLPSGWTITAAQGVVIKDQDPHLPLGSTPVAVEDTTAAYSLVFSGLTGGSIYQIGVWLKWMTPNGDAAYSVALRDQDTPS
jgi:hypothetical protein